MNCIDLFYISNILDLMLTIPTGMSVSMPVFMLFPLKGGPAENTGLKPGDCILEINGINVR